jgi:hypothetical protein
MESHDLRAERESRLVISGTLLEMFGLQVAMRMMVLVLTLVMVSGIPSIWKGYVWVNNVS